MCLNLYRSDDETTKQTLMQMVKRIIDTHGMARVNDKVNGVTALHSAVAKGSLKMVKLLIENGASPNEKIGKTLDNDNDDLYELYDNSNALTFLGIFFSLWALTLTSVSFATP